jgi:hypothetical protein
LSSHHRVFMQQSRALRATPASKIDENPYLSPEPVITCRRACFHDPNYCSIKLFRFHAVNSSGWTAIPPADLPWGGHARTKGAPIRRWGRVERWRYRMFQKCTVSTVLAAILTITASAALAAPRQKPPPTINRPAPISGAEWWQNKGIAEDMVGVPYRPRR